MIFYFLAMAICLICCAISYRKAGRTQNRKDQEAYLTLAIIDIFAFWMIFLLWAT